MKNTKRKCQQDKTHEQFSAKHRFDSTKAKERRELKRSLPKIGSYVKVAFNPTKYSKQIPTQYLLLDLDQLWRVEASKNKYFVLRSEYDIAGESDNDEITHIKVLKDQVKHGIFVWVVVDPNQKGDIFVV